MTVRHVGRFGPRGFILQLGAPGTPGSLIGVPATFWQIEYEGRIYPWRPVHPADRADLKQLMRAAIAYLKGELQRAG
jgi:hypothetical protein